MKQKKIIQIHFYLRLENTKVFALRMSSTIVLNIHLIVYNEKAKFVG